MKQRSVVVDRLCQRQSLEQQGEVSDGPLLAELRPGRWALADAGPSPQHFYVGRSLVRDCTEAESLIEGSGDIGIRGKPNDTKPWWGFLKERTDQCFAYSTTPIVICDIHTTQARRIASCRIWINVQASDADDTSVVLSH